MLLSDRKESKKMEKTRFRLNICGVEIIVSGNADDTATQQIADTVRARMQTILNTAYAATVEKAAVITALNLCEELEEANRRTAALEEEIRALRENAGKSDTEPASPARWIAEPVAPTGKKPLRNPFRPDMGDQTGLVSFFLKEAEAENEEEEI